MKAKLSCKGHPTLGKTAVLPISVGKEYHEGEKFIATLKSVEKRFARCDILIADTLQRHNHEDENRAECLYRGDEWLKRNQSVIDSLNIPCKIFRWDDCLMRPNYDSSYETILEFFESSITFRKSVKRDIIQFAVRNNKRNDISVYQKSLNYILEELSVLLSFCVEKEYHFVVYPGSLPCSLAPVREAFIDSNLIQTTDLSFRK
jgi:tRNA-dependent cyclodipeptide synthase